MSSQSTNNSSGSLYSLKATLASGEEQSLSSYEGQVILIVNTASACGFTPQYEGLESLYQRYRDQGLVILGFPCDQFGHQEPGTEEEILSFCRLNYGVSFPIFAKTLVNGPDAHPLFKHLKKHSRGLFGTEAIKWNFTKFLVNRSGEVVKRFGSVTKPNQLSAKIEELL